MKKNKTLSNICYILKYYIKYVPGYFWGQTLFTIVVSAIWTIKGPITTKYLIDALLNKKDIKTIILFLSGVTLLVLIRHIYACYIVEYLETIANARMQGKLLKELYQKASKMDLKYYESPQYYTDYVWAAEQAKSQFSNILALYNTLIARMSEMLFVGGVMVAIHPVLLLFAIAMGIVRFYTQRKIIIIRYNANKEAKPFERQRDYSKRVFYLSDYAKEVRLTGISEIIREQFSDANDRLYKIWEDGGRKTFSIHMISDAMLHIIGSLGMYTYLAYEILERKLISAGDFGALLQSASRFSDRLRKVLDVLVQMSEQSLYIEKFRRFMAYEPKIEQSKGIQPPEENSVIKLENVSFAYDDMQGNVLNNVNMTIRPHQKIAIVGYNGAGKTTLIKLLLRLYDPTDGEITVDGKNIKEYITEEYRKQFAVVMQDFHVYAATLGENVAMDFVNDKEEDQLKDALYKAGFKDKFETLPRGLSTDITREFSEDGTELSGGEKQKIAIARTFYKEANYAIMDEPSSALDPIAEYNMNRNLYEVSKDKTVIFISHRLSATIMADVIYMFENGSIIESGNHEELMKLNGKYAEMFNKQASNYL